MKNNTENKNRQGFWGVVRPHTGGGLALRIILCLLIPEAYLMLCGLVIDRMLHLYSLTTFVFVSYVVIALVCLAVLIASIVNFARRDKAPRAAKVPRKEKKPAEEKKAAPAVEQPEAAPVAAETENTADEIDYANLDLSELLGEEKGE